MSATSQHMPKPSYLRPALSLKLTGAGEIAVMYNYKSPDCCVQKQQVHCVTCQSSGAVWKSRWTSWAPVPNKPTVSVDVKQHSTNRVTLNTDINCKGRG